MTSTPQFARRGGTMASTAMASAPALALAGRASKLKRPSRERVASRRSAATTWRLSAARASNATMALDVQDDEEDDEEEDARREPTPEELDAEARVLLQWPELSAQVRAFTATTLGYRACDPVLPLGADFDASRRLLAETSAAAALRAKGRFPREAFEGTRDIRPWVMGAARGRVLSGGSLADIATTSAAAKAVGAEVRAAATETEAETRALASLRELAAPLGSIPETLEPEIRRCIAVPGGTVRDDASEKLREIREERRETETALRAMLLEKANFLARKNFAERAQVVSRLGRECIPMKAGAQSEMDGVVLGASGTGATVFKEPAEATPLNNRLMELAAEEEEETERVLRALTKEVLGSDRGEALLNATEALAELDLAAARAEHAEWLSAKPPRLFLVDDEIGTKSADAVRLPGMQHPLLLQPRLPSLPRGGKVGEDEEVDGWESMEDDSKRRSGTRVSMTRLWKKRRREFRRASRRRMSSRWIFVPHKTRGWSPSPVPTPAARRRRSRRSDWRCSWRARACTSRRTRARPRPCRGPRACWRTWATRRASTSTADSPRSARTSRACAASSPPRGTRATPWWSCWTSPAAGRTPRRAPRSPPPCSAPRRTGRRSRWPRATTRR
jgi:hypothetical protein